MSSKILIIDDQREILDLLQEILEPEGYSVRTLQQADDIMNEIKDFGPDLILMDFLLSGINGGEFCAQIKRNPSTQQIPVILLSAHARVLESLGHYGYDDFVAKPFDIQHLLDAICKYIAAV